MRFLRSYGIESALVATLGLAVLFFGYLAVGLLPREVIDAEFSGNRALQDAGRQMAFGARVTGTPSSVQMGDWLVQQLTGLGWDVVIQEFGTADARKGRNIVAMRSPERVPSAPVVLLATHYDTRMVADADLSGANRTCPAPGANNGASGTAVLLELARTLNLEAAGHTVCLAFFDGDANAGLPGWDGRVGSAHFASTVDKDAVRCAGPEAVVALDKVGADSPHFTRDPEADSALQDSIWQIAADLGYGDAFVDEEGETAINAQTPFAERGVATALIADASYLDGATLADTLDRLRAPSLERVGRTLEGWLEGGAVKGDR